MKEQENHSSFDRKEIEIEDRDTGRSRDKDRDRDRDRNSDRNSDRNNKSEKEDFLKPINGTKNKNPLHSRGKTIDQKRISQIEIVGRVNHPKQEAAKKRILEKIIGPVIIAQVKKAEKAVMAH